ncbi:DUF7738 domain-containing protein [Chryseolinea lacunae]|uniref:DUF7738 domain-containing protein n=1 Tax=Chryseolinea lacunae TaxID=2801331 RepID=A0ABS1L0H6_9BACT|nr:hypothetical protein [Chryseolinea lacunae]MBL0745013.1 hypothetical protein [Chryseolinea lacunae]
MKKFLLSLLVLVCVGTVASAQINLNADFTKQEIVINGVAFTKASTLEDYEKVLGKAERIEKIGGKDKIFAYDKSGISLSLKTNTNVVQEVYITYIYDNDKKVAKERFAGSLSLNGKTITDKTVKDDVAKLSGLDLKAAMTGLYLGRGKELSLTVYYPEATIGQIAVSFP